MAIVRSLMVILAVVLVALLYRLWLTDDGMREVWRLSQAVEAQRDLNVSLAQRNRELDAEVKDLKEGIDAVEERARKDLGMIRSGESFFQIVEKERSESGARRDR